MTRTGTHARVISVSCHLIQRFGFVVWSLGIGHQRQLPPGKRFGVQVRELMFRGWELGSRVQDFGVGFHRVARTQASAASSPA